MTYKNVFSFSVRHGEKHSLCLFLNFIKTSSCGWHTFCVTPPHSHRCFDVHSLSIVTLAEQMTVK